MIIIHDAYEVARACKEATQLQLYIECRLELSRARHEHTTLQKFNTVPISSKPSFQAQLPDLKTVPKVEETRPARCLVPATLVSF